ncbi:hypothetical protein E1301_Tti015091 [Triplophysa tibetana]|uniref:Uncharacterized protein n=1 Tax=Triplophysa tibetana TaxID=1572043 RepID=A0A5A9NTH6_9TELE|nr:hypothetical protein E1301_Tti015091 [Triplophysa tibetana]
MRPTSVEEWKDARAVCRPAPRTIITSSSIKKRRKTLFGSSRVIHKNLRCSFSSLNLCINIPPSISLGCSKLHIGLHPPSAGSLNVYARASAINLRHLRRTSGKTAVGRERACWTSRSLRVGITVNGCKRPPPETGQTELDPEVELKPWVIFFRSLLSTVPNDEWGGLVGGEAAVERAPSDAVPL